MTSSTYRDEAHASLLNEIDFQPIFILGLPRSGTTLSYKLLTQSNAFNYFQAYHVVKYDEIMFNHLNQREHQVRAELNALYQDSGVKDRGFDHIAVTSSTPAEYRVILQNKGKLLKPKVFDSVRTLFKGGHLIDLFFDSLKLSPESAPLLIEACKKLQFTSQSKRPVLLKNPLDSNNFIYLKTVFPQAKFIFIHRDPMDILNSQLKALQLIYKTPSQYLKVQSRVYQRLVGNRLSFAALRFIVSSPKTRKFRLGSLLRYINRTASYMQTHLDFLDQDQILFVNYQQLCQQPNFTVSRIMTFLNLTPETRINYEELIAPRPVQWLAELAEHEAEIRQQLHSYDQRLNELALNQASSAYTEQYDINSKNIYGTI